MAAVGTPVAELHLFRAFARLAFPLLVSQFPAKTPVDLVFGLLKAFRQGLGVADERDDPPVLQVGLKHAVADELDAAHVVDVLDGMTGTLDAVGEGPKLRVGHLEDTVGVLPLQIHVRLKAVGPARRQGGWRLVRAFRFLVAVHNGASYSPVSGARSSQWMPRGGKKKAGTGGGPTARTCYDCVVLLAICHEKRPMRLQAVRRLLTPFRRHNWDRNLPRPSITYSLARSSDRVNELTGQFDNFREIFRRERPDRLSMPKTASRAAGTIGLCGPKISGPVVRLPSGPSLSVRSLAPAGPQRRPVGRLTARGRERILSRRRPITAPFIS